MQFTYNNKDYEISDVLYDIPYDNKEMALAILLDSHCYINERTVEAFYQAFDEGIQDEFLNHYKKCGFLHMPYTATEDTITTLETLFKADNRFHGHAPRILPAIAAVYDYYKSYQDEIEINDFVFKFNINTVKGMLDAGIPEMQVAMLYYQYDIPQCNQIANHPHIAENVCTLLQRSYEENNPDLLVAANWVVDHARTNEKTIKKLVKKADKIQLDKNHTVEAIETKLSNLRAKEEVKKIEKAYKEPGFKFKNCTCELKDVGKIITDDKYNAYIMLPTDKRQVLLGYDTHCCQKLGDAGESAMMHGLLNPKAGFWVVEDKSSGEIKCQAEIWEENEDTLVFDNIELANDAELALYQNIIGKWLQENSYQNVKMGIGYNEIYRSGDFRECGRVCPTITPYEAYVLSYEDDADQPDVNQMARYVPFPTEEARAKYIQLQEKDALLELKSEEKAQKLLEDGVINYYTYVYCDSENASVWLKENGKVEPYFAGFHHNIQQLKRAVERINNPLITTYMNHAFHLNMPDIDTVRNRIIQTARDDYECDDIIYDYTTFAEYCEAINITPSDELFDLYQNQIEELDIQEEDEEEYDDEHEVFF